MVSAVYVSKCIGSILVLLCAVYIELQTEVDISAHYGLLLVAFDVVFSCVLYLFYVRADNHGFLPWWPYRASLVTILAGLVLIGTILSILNPGMTP